MGEVKYVLMPVPQLKTVESRLVFVIDWIEGLEKRRCIDSFDAEVLKTEIQHAIFGLVPYCDGKTLTEMKGVL